VTRAFLWIHLVLATLVVIGVFVQVYLVAAHRSMRALGLGRHGAPGPA
jgi:hypothetical protein